MSTALLVIDAQTGMLENQDRPIHELEKTLVHIHRLIAKARAAQSPVVYIQDDDIGTPGSADWEVHPCIAPQAGDVRIRKLAADAFHDSSLKAELSALGATSLILTGFQTQACVDATARGAAMRGYAVTLAADAHSNAGSSILTPEQIIAWHNRILDGMYGPNHGFSGAGIEVKLCCEIEFGGRA